MALIIYARRREGYAVPYSAPPKLYDYTVKVGDKLNISQKAILEGDILHFGFQTALVAKHDLKEKGLADDDLILHTYHGVAELVKYSQLPYRDAFFDVLRWRDESVADVDLR